MGDDIAIIYQQLSEYSVEDYKYSTMIKFIVLDKQIKYKTGFHYTLNI